MVTTGAKVLKMNAQLCPTLCDPMDCTVHGILRARILEWVAFPSSRASSPPGDQTQALYQPRGVGWGGRFKKEGIYVYRWLIAQLVNNPPAMQEILVWFLGREDPLEEGKATHSSILPWRIPQNV